MLMDDRIHIEETAIFNWHMDDGMQSDDIPVPLLYYCIVPIFPFADMNVLLVV